VKRPLHSTYHIVIENGKRVLISDCKRINEYTPEKIEVTLHGGSVTVCGQGLTLCDFFGDEIKSRVFCLKGRSYEKKNADLYKYCRYDTYVLLRLLRGKGKGLV